MAIQFNLLLYGLRSLKEDILATTDKNLTIFSIDYDLLDQKVFWTDLGAESIQWLSMDTKNKGTVVKGRSLAFTNTHGMKKKLRGHSRSKHWFNCISLTKRDPGLLVG